MPAAVFARSDAAKGLECLGHVALVEEPAFCRDLLYGKRSLRKELSSMVNADG